MNIKRIICAILVITLICTCFISCGKSKPVNVYAFDNGFIGNLNNYKDEGSNITTYLDIVENEATKIIAQLNDCSDKKAKKIIQNSQYSIYTYYDSNASSSILKAYDEIINTTNLAIAVTDLNGNLVASVGRSGNINFATKPTSPYSSLKPLSVYAQGIENGVIHWSSTYEDSPYKKIEEDGQERNWPTNSTGKYSYDRVTVSYALKHSLNTVSVKIASRIGINNLVDFLSSKLGIPLTEERKLSTVSGEEEIIGNIALGYLRRGVSPVDMAGYYQIFASGGVYTEPKTIDKICDKQGNVIYQRQKNEKQVISPATSDIMNRLLREVVTKGATGEEAACNGIQVAGKTGTGDNNAGNWFVGITPNYSCAVWHGTNSSNIAPEIFSQVITEIYNNNPDLSKNFTNHINLSPMVYCTETGLLASARCVSAEKGYYHKDNIPKICDKH